MRSSKLGGEAHSPPNLPTFPNGIYNRLLGDMHAQALTTMRGITRTYVATGLVVLLAVACASPTTPAPPTAAVPTQPAKAKPELGLPVLKTFLVAAQP